MRRRDVIAGLVVAATVGHAQAQQTGKVYRVAIVDAAIPVAQLTETGGVPVYRGLFEELRRLGHVEGGDLLIERYSGEGRAEQFSELVREVVRGRPDLIFAFSNRLVLAFKEATATIPVVAVMADPVVSGIVPSLARPGGNITGVSSDAGAEIWGKRLELLKEAVPRASRVAFLASARVWESRSEAALREAARRAGISLIGAPLDAPFGEPEYRRAFAVMAQERADALVVAGQPENFNNLRVIVELAEKARLPAIYSYSQAVKFGGLMTYANDAREIGRRAAREIDQILRGAKPSEIPIYQPTTFELGINLKAAKALGIEMPPSLLGLADEVIE